MQQISTLRKYLVTILIIPLCAFQTVKAATLNLKLFIQGYYIGAGMMTPVLNNCNGNPDLTDCDYVTINLLEQVSPYAVIESVQGMLHVDGTCTVNLNNAVIGNSYYVDVCHRGTVQTMSALPVTISIVTNYDFSVSPSKAYGNNEIDQLNDNVWEIYSGDLDGDCNIDLNDYNVLQNDIQQAIFGCVCTDLNGDGFVDAIDMLILDQNMQNFISCQSPGNLPACNCTSNLCIPLGGTALAASGNPCSGGDIQLSLSGASTGVQYMLQWQVSSDAGATWTDISGATNNIFMASCPSITKYFRCKVSCISSNLYQLSTSVILNPCIPTGFDVDSIYCNGLNPLGQQQYSFSLKVNNNSAIAASIVSLTSSYGAITGLSTNTIGVGINSITGIFATSLESRSFICLNLSVFFPGNNDTCNLKTCLFLPNCSPNVCDSNLLENGTFLIGNNPGDMTLSGSVADWNRAYGNPSVLNNGGCEDAGYIQLKGNLISGDAIKQSLGIMPKILVGRQYGMTCCVKVDSALSALPYIKLRAIAYNGSLPSGNNHPLPDADIAIIGYTGKISSTEWTQIKFDRWIANKNFDNVAINIYNNDSLLFSVGYIDGVCLHISPGCDCDDIETDSLGDPIIPDDLSEYYELDSTTSDNIEMFMGRYKDLSGAFTDTGIDTSYSTLPDTCCRSIGGTIPNEAINYNIDDSLAGMGINISADSIGNLIQHLSDSLEQVMLNTPMDSLFAFMANGACALDSLCFCDSTHVPFYDPNSPFQGRDIVFVHGLSSSAIWEKLSDNNSYQNTTWPKNRSQFYSGGWHDYAIEYWKAHINHFLRGKGFKNRFIYVSWATTQTLPYAVSAMLSQINDAMISGTGVELLNSSDQRGTKDFGRDGYVIISHSTGGLVSDVAMGFAAKSATVPLFKLALGGDRSYLANLASTHIALQGALNGSNIAAAIMLVFTTTPALAPLINVVANIGNFDWRHAVGAVTAVQRSVLFDLTPPVSKIWMQTLGTASSVRTLTVAGGHPDKYTLLLKVLLHSGFDDGVLSINSQGGNPSILGASRYQPTESKYNIKVFEMTVKGQKLDRSVKYFVDQCSEYLAVKVLQKLPGGSAIPDWPYVFAANVPELSPTGMVQPVEHNSYIWNANNRYTNHYSFIQSASDHFAGPTGDATSVNDPYAAPFNYKPTAGFNSVCNEEVRVVTDNNIYGCLPAPGGCLVSPLVDDLQGNWHHGLKISLRLKKNANKPRPKWLSWLPNEKWIWKRTYYKMIDFDNMTECDYVYKYVLKP